MAEVVNRLYSKESKVRAKSVVEHYLKEKGLYEYCPSNYRNNIVNYVTHICNNTDRFPNCLVNQAERGVSHEDVAFVTKERLVSCFNEIIEITSNKVGSVCLQKQSMQWWISWVEPNLDYVLKDINEIKRGLVKQKKLGRN